VPSTVHVAVSASKLKKVMPSPFAAEPHIEGRAVVRKTETLRERERVCIPRDRAPLEN